MKTVATIEARMASTRLPGKVLLPALGRPMLQHLVTRLQSVTSLSVSSSPYLLGNTVEWKLTSLFKLPLYSKILVPTC